MQISAQIVQILEFFEVKSNLSIKFEYEKFLVDFKAIFIFFKKLQYINQKMRKPNLKFQNNIPEGCSNSLPKT